MAQIIRINGFFANTDKDGKPYTVRYDAVNAMLLNEFLNEHRKVEQLEKQIEALTITKDRVFCSINGKE
jgi:hypothetical protein